MFVCEFMEKYMAGNELSHCFSGDAFLFIDSIIFTIKEALQAATVSKNTLFHLERVWGSGGSAPPCEH